MDNSFLKKAQDYLFFLKRYLPVATLGQTKFNVLLGMDNAFLKKLQEWKNQTFLSKMRNQSSEFFERLERSAGNCIFIRLEKMAFVRKNSLMDFIQFIFFRFCRKEEASL